MAAGSSQTDGQGMTSQNAVDYKIDEALWAAYRRHDKKAVTWKLLGRYLAGITRPKTRSRPLRKQEAKP
jgi:hypothetical protein